MVAVASVAAAGLLVSAFAGSGGQPRAASTAVVQVHVEDYARISADDWEQVKREVERIYLTAGISLTWAGPLRVPRQQWPRDGVRRVAVAVVNIDTPFGGDARDTSDVLGRAAPGYSRAWIFANRTWAAAGTGAVDATLLLARVFAHEIGHLLLPSQAHADRGIMKGDLDRMHVGFFTFTPQQVSLLIDGIRRETRVR